MAHVPRLYHPGRIVPGPLALGPDAARHLTTVLRMRAGEEFLLFPGDGSEWLACIESLDGKRGARATVMDLVRQEPSAALQVELCCALVRNARFETVVEKCTELGVDVIRPLTCERTNRGDAPSSARKERWERIAVEASEQCGRLRVPVVADAVAFDEFVARSPGPFVIADGSGETWEAVASLLPDAGPLTVHIGPEGGWSDAELARARAAGGLTLRLGRNILRTETAAIAALTLLHART